MSLPKLRNLLLIFFLIFFSAFAGFQLGVNEVKIRWEKYRPSYEVVGKLPPKNIAPDFSLFWKVWEEMTVKYVDKTKLDAQKMVYGAISGMVSAVGDPYTMFLPPAQNKEVKEELNGSFEGIGAQLGVKEKRIVVIAPLHGSPAQKAGVKSGDWIIKVNDAETKDLALPEAVAKIRGPKGTKVKLTILHEKAAQPEEREIVRETIILKSVEWEEVKAGVAHLKVIRFGEQTKPQWDRAVAEITAYMATSSAKNKGVVLDVRNDPGGYLSGAVYLASEFLSSGVVVKQEDYRGEGQTYSVNRRGRFLDIPLVVLVNRGTASASEILAGALQVAGRAKLVGEKTFGKGSIQESQDLAGGAGLHITTAKWLLSDGAWINEKGLTADVIIDNDEKTPEKDLQLEKAIQILGSK